MQRYDNYGPGDDQPKPLGDRGFIGVNMRVDPSQLPPGYVAEAVNMRFRNGVAETRLGFTVLPWCNKIVAGKTQPWGTVHGTGIFSDPFTLQEYLVIAADGGVYYTRAGNTPQALALAGGETITGDVSFTQAFDVLVMHRGTEPATLQMPRISQGFSLVEQTPTGNGTYPIPNATHSIFVQNRLFIPNDNDELAASDAGDYTRYVPVAQELKINQGSADKLVAAFKFNDTTIIAFKEHSIYAVSNVYGDLSEIRQDELTGEFGLVARQSIAHVGKDLWFLSELGVMSLTQTEQNKIQGVVLPVSDPIQPLIDRINWRYAASAVSAVWDSKYYLAVPLDDAEVFGPELAGGGAVYNVGFEYVISGLTSGATYRWIMGVEQEGVGAYQMGNGTEHLTASADFVAQGASVTLFGSGTVTASLMRVYKGVNNAVLVYDFLNRAWAGHDEAPGFAVREFRQVAHNNKRRLFAITHDGYLCLYEEDFEDQLPVPYVDVDWIATATPTDQLDVLSVNVGTSVRATVDLVNAAGTILGTGGSAATTIQNMWVDVTDTGGYSPGAGTPFTAPGTVPVKTSTGVRFYSTNGVLPAVTWAANLFTVAGANTQAITSTLTTRGYGSDVQALADFNWLVADVQTWAPEYSIDVVSSGIEEEQSIADAVTRSRTAYYEPSDAEPFDQSNDNGDFLAPYRQDYSVLLGDAVGATDELALHTITDGVPLGLHQEQRITQRVNMKGRSAQIRIANAAGRIRVMAVTLEMDEKPVYAGEKA